MLIRLRGCAGWSAPLLFAYGIRHVFAWPGPPHLDFCCTILHIRLIQKWNFKRGLRDWYLIENLIHLLLNALQRELFAELNWMAFPERVKFQKVTMMYKSMNNLVLHYIGQLFQHKNEIHNHNLRSTSDDLLYVPKPNCESFRNSLAYSGAKIMNYIPLNIKSTNSVEQFKDRYVQWIGASYI